MKPGKGDTLSKLGMIGIGGAGLGSMIQGDAEREKRIKAEIEKAKLDDASYDNKIKSMKAKQEHEREESNKHEKKESIKKELSEDIDKAVTKKKLKKLKQNGK